MPTATMTSKGQITPLRRSARELYGLLCRPSQKPRSIRQMDRALCDQLAEAEDRVRKSG